MRTRATDLGRVLEEVPVRQRHDRVQPGQHERVRLELLGAAKGLPPGTGVVPVEHERRRTVRVRRREVSREGPRYRKGGYIRRHPRSSTALFADMALTIAALKCAAPAACGYTAAITILRGRATTGLAS